MVTESMIDSSIPVVPTKYISRNFAGIFLISLFIKIPSCLKHSSPPYYLDICLNDNMATKQKFGDISNGGGSTK